MMRRVLRSAVIRFLTTKAGSASKPTAAAASPTWWKRYISDPEERYVTELGRVAVAGCAAFLFKKKSEFEASCRNLDLQLAESREAAKRRIKRAGLEASELIT